MRIRMLVTRLMTVAICITAATVIWQADVKAADAAKGKGTGQAAETLADTGCLTCHGEKSPALKVKASDGKMRPMRAIAEGKYRKGVHGEMTCVGCHANITDSKAPHKKVATPKANCVACHEGMWETVKKQGLTKEKERLGVVVKNIEAYKNSYHARPNTDDPTRPNATCDNCHDTHYFNVPPRGTARRTDWHLTIPTVCGEQCHTEQLEAYVESIHGTEVMEKHNPKAATCTDCHTTHNIANTSKDVTKLLILENCGSCHLENFASYGDTYHGQVAKLGYAYTAKCYNCHGSHAILKVDNPKSTVHPNNRLKTCKSCHDGKKRKEATAGFVTFGPHANAHDFKRYPQVWFASRFMLALLVGVFAYFWAHSALWYYREYKDRKARKSRPQVQTEKLPSAETRHVRRFGPIWRLAHLTFAVSTMTLVLTGVTVLYANSAWAPVIMKLLGGPAIAGLIHRISATVFLGIFFTHLVYVLVHLIRDRSFKWFGPDSLVPRWQDFKDAYGMFRWFFGKGPRPVFDRWTYWEKFDYWAVFWGVSVIGGSGLMLAFPEVTASVLPGWVFNVITLVHGEEAFLAAVFLFTVHFFNNHFRPDKLPPPDVVMFTGSMSIEEFRREHTMQYNRLVETGQLEKYLVDAPSRPMTAGSKALGLTLIAIGLILLVLVIVGFVGGLTPR